MTQVVDASVVVAALITNLAEGRWCEERLREAPLVAPHLMPFEAANILRRTHAWGAIEATETAEALDRLRRLPIKLVPFTALTDRTWALRANLTTYDASYVATAERVGARLVTLDRRLARAPGLACEVVVPPVTGAGGASGPEDEG